MSDRPGDIIVGLLYGVWYAALVLIAIMVASDLSWLLRG
jgi:hypothetical protein